MLFFQNELHFPHSSSFIAVLTISVLYDRVLFEFLLPVTFQNLNILHGFLFVKGKVDNNEHESWAIEQANPFFKHNNERHNPPSPPTFTASGSPSLNAIYERLGNVGAITR
jgi:hypothetical protein